LLGCHGGKREKEARPGLDGAKLAREKVRVRV
jgi:hypothetical protein